MIIEFPKKYSVIEVSDTLFFIHILLENAQEAYELIKQQLWVDATYVTGDKIDVFISRAYEITSQQAVDALSKLCEYVMSPPAQMDDALSNELSSILSEITDDM